MSKKYVFLILFIICGVIISFLFFRQRPNWDAHSRYRLITGNDNGEVSFLLFDPRRGEIREFEVPLDTHVESAYGLGEWKISSLWKLGIQEKKGGGQMLERSLVRGYGLPIEGYLEYSGAVEPFNLARKLIFAHDTNISIRDRLSLAWFALHARLSSDEKLSSQTIILTAEEVSSLTDGIVTVSNTEELTQEQSKSLNRIVSNLGGKILDFSTLVDHPDQNCSVSGSSMFAQKLATILNCDFTKSESETTFLNVGREFAKNF